MHRRDIFQSALDLGIEPYHAMCIALHCDHRLREQHLDEAANRLLAETASALAGGLGIEVPPPRILTSKNAGFLATAVKGVPPTIIMDHEFFESYRDRHPKRFRSITGHEYCHIFQAPRSEELYRLHAPEIMEEIDGFNAAVRERRPVIIGGHTIRLSQLFTEDASIPIFRNQSPASWWLESIEHAVANKQPLRRHHRQCEFQADLWGAVAGSPGAMVNFLDDAKSLHHASDDPLHPRIRARKHFIEHAADRRMIELLAKDLYYTNGREPPSPAKNCRYP